MKSIAINFTLTEGEFELLRLGKCDKPSPQRIKMQLLQEAARNLRNMSESVLSSARRETPSRGEGPAARGERPKIVKWKELPPNRPIVARDPRDGKVKPVQVVITKPKPKPNRKRPNPSDYSSQPSAFTGAEWMDDENVRKLREPEVC